MRLIKNKNVSIFYRLLLSSLFIAFIIVITLSLIFYYSSKNSIQKHFKEIIHQQINSIAYNFSQMKNSLLLEQELVAFNPTVDNYLMSSKLNYEINVRALEKLFTVSIAHSVSFQSIYFVDYLGKEKVRVDRDTGRIKEYRDLSQSRLFMEVESDIPDRVSVRTPYINESGEIIFSVGVNIIDGDIGEFGGAILIDYNLNEFLESLNKIRINGENVVWALSPDGQLLNRPSNKEATFDPTPFMVAGFNEKAEFLALKEGMLVYQDQSIIPNMPFIRIAVTIPYSYILHGTRKILRFSIVVSFIFALVIVIGVYYQTNHFTKPIVELSKAASGLAKGHLLTEVNVKAVGEVKTLVDSFNQMAKDMKLSRDKITQRSEELDAAIEELDAANEELNATNEELNAINEELSAANEELDNTNEELESRVDERTRELNEAQELAHIGNWTWDIRSGKMTWSDEVYRIFGFTPHEFIPTYEDFLNAVQPDEREFVNDSVNAAVTNKKPYAIDYKIVLPDGTEKSVFSRGLVPHSDVGARKMMLGTIQDITEQEEARREKEELWHQLLQAQKMESIGRLTGKIAHDFNNFLTSIIGFSSLLIDRMADDSNEKDLVTRINNAGQKASNLIDQLLAFSRTQILMLKVINLNIIIKNISDILIGVVGEEAVFELKTDTPVKNIKADDVQIEQILMNLIMNARHAIKKGGRITVETCDVTLDEISAKDHHGAAPGAYVKLSVTDTGVGMTSETMQRIFEPFFTTRKKGKGTGLGLSTVFGIVNQHNGFVHVKSVLGKGSTFEIYLPAVKELVDEQMVEKEQVKLYGKETILIIDDDSNNLYLYANLIKPLGYNVLKAQSGEDALQIMKDKTRTIDLMVTDVVMPGMDGWNLFQTIKKSRPEMKVVFVSGFIDNPIVLNSILKNKMPFLKKPFHPNDLICKLREVLDKKNNS